MQMQMQLVEIASGIRQTKYLYYNSDETIRSLIPKLIANGTFLLLNLFDAQLIILIYFSSFAYIICKSMTSSNILEVRILLCIYNLL